MKPSKNYKKVRDWLRDKPAGHRFTAAQIAKAKNLTGADVGNIIKWQSDIRKLPKRLPGNVTQWEKMKVA